MPQVAITTLFTLFLRERKKKSLLHAFTAELAGSFITCSQLYIGFFSHRIYPITVLGHRGVFMCVCECDCGYKDGSSIISLEKQNKILVRAVWFSCFLTSIQRLHNSRGRFSFSAFKNNSSDAVCLMLITELLALCS